MRRNVITTSSLSNKGFTLIELLVTLTIFAVLVLTALSSLGSSTRHVQLQMNVETIASELRSLQSGVKHGQTNGDYFICKGMLISQSGTYEFIEGDFDETCINTTIGQSGELTGNSELISIVDTQTDGELGSDIAVIFLPPRGEILFTDETGSEYDVSSVTLNFENSSGDGFSRSLTINKAGQITY